MAKRTLHGLEPVSSGPKRAVKRTAGAPQKPIEVGGRPVKFADGGPVALVSKGIEAIGRAMNTERGKSLKAADAAVAEPKKERAGGDASRAKQINAAVGE